MSLVIPQVYLAPNWKLHDHNWMRQKHVDWVLKYVDKNPPRVEEVDSDDDTLTNDDFKDATILCFDHLVNDEVANPPTTLLNHLPQAVSFILMAKHLIKDDQNKSILICSPKGQSRAPAVLVATLILTQNVTAEVAANHVVAQHSKTNISRHLLSQLGAFETTLRNHEQKHAFYMLMNKHMETLENRLCSSTQQATEQTI